MILLGIFLLVSGTFAACPATYQQINGGDCFKLYKTQQTFDSAEEICKNDGGHLASVHSKEEQTALAAIIDDTTPLIGMKCTDGVASHCSWVDGSTNDYTNFPGGTPVVAYGQCVHLQYSDDLWYPWNCGTMIVGFLCRTSPVTTCTGDYKPYNGGCAALRTTPRNQADAEAVCALEGGHLASIHSDDDNAFYQKMGSDAGLNNNIYIGLSFPYSCNTCNQDYHWSDGKPYDYKHFANQFPNLIFGYCVQMMLSTEFGTLGQWTNIDCTVPMAFVCWKTSGETPIKAAANCPSIQFFYDQGTVYSPNFPVSIPPGQKCEYVLATAIGTKASVRFPVFSTDTATTLSLYNGLDDVIPSATLSTSVNSQTVYESTTNVLKMIFTASTASTGYGWEAEFTTVGGGAFNNTDPDFDPTTCPPQQYTADTYLYSPNWPSPYSPLTNCVYHITSKDSTKKLVIQFDYVDTEQCCDVVVVYDGPNSKSPILGLVSGQSNGNVKQFFSTGTTLTLEFSSDSNTEGKGWIASVFNL